MIPQAYIREWAKVVPWQTNEQVEQDLVICRALVEIYSDEWLASSLAFRGGTALHKLYLIPQPRYSEDIDLVQIRSEPSMSRNTNMIAKVRFIKGSYPKATIAHCLVFLMNLYTFTFVESSVMAKPIKETPILTGKDASAFVSQMKVADNTRVSASERARICEIAGYRQILMPFPSGIDCGDSDLNDFLLHD